jgi:DNA-binding CsgD family transcriptional regulator
MAQNAAWEFVQGGSMSTGRGSTNTAGPNWGAGLFVVACASAIGLLFGAELVLPRDVTTGTAILIPVVLIALRLGHRATLAVVGIAILTRVVSAALGDISAALAIFEGLSYAVAATVGAICRREFGARARQAHHSIQFADLQIDLPLPAAFQSLTERERQVISLAQRGLTAAQIGERLFIGRRTVESHLESAYLKLGVRSKRELIDRTWSTASTKR